MVVKALKIKSNKFLIYKFKIIYPLAELNQRIFNFTICTTFIHNYLSN